MALRGIVEVDEHQFYLTPASQDPTAIVASAGFVDVGEHHLIINTGIASGPARVSLVIHSGAVGLVDESYPDVAQASISVSHDPLLLIDVTGNVADEYSADLSGVKGNCGVRVSARGRDLAIDQIIDDPVEEYLIEIFDLAGPLEPALLREPGVEIRHKSSPTHQDPSMDKGAADATVRLFGPVKSP